MSVCIFYQCGHGNWNNATVCHGYDSGILGDTVIALRHAMAAQYFKTSAGECICHYYLLGGNC